MSLDSLTLLGKNDIPFIQAEVTLHQPTCKEIGYIGEEDFFTGCQALTFSKERLVLEDKVDLSSVTNFDILMTMIRDKSTQSQKNILCMKMVLSLLLPDYQIMMSPAAVGFIKDEQVHQLTSANYDAFQEIIRQIFCLKKIFGQSAVQDYNPANAAAQALVDKFKERQRKLQEIKQKQGKGQNISIISRRISILAVGEHKDINTLTNYTVYQLFDEFDTYQRKLAYDMYVQAKMAGAKDIEDVKNWMEDDNDSSSNNK